MWTVIRLIWSYFLWLQVVGGQEVLDGSMAPAVVVNLTLQSEDGSYVDSRQITVTIPPHHYVTPDPNAVVIPNSWTWTAFSRWSHCSTTCGAGLQVAERFCVLVRGARVVEAAATVDPCLEQDRSNSETSAETSALLATTMPGQPSQKQYRKCESQPCPVSRHHSTPGRHENDIDNNYFGGGDGKDYEGKDYDGEPEQAPDDFPSAEPGDLRFELCSKYNEKEFAGGRKYTWIPFQTGYAPCALLCRPVEDKFYVSFAERVPDGLSCERIVTEPDGDVGRIVSSSQGVCLNGTCQVSCWTFPGPYTGPVMDVIYFAAILVLLAIGCDGMVGSDRRVDACGVCAGDSTSCQKIKIEFLEQNLPRGHNKIGTIPRGACNISLTESKPSGNVFALRTVQGFFLNGEWTASPNGDYAAAGSRFRYQHVTNGNSLRRHGERITAKGPLTEDIEIILVTKRPNTGITLEYSISNKQQDAWKAPSRRHRADRVDHRPEINSNLIDTRPYRGDIPSISEDFVETPLHIEEPTTTTTPAPPPRDRYKYAVVGYKPCSKTCGKGVRQSNIVCISERENRPVDDAYCRNIVRPANFQEACHLAPCPGEWQYGDWSECSVTCGTGSETREARCMQVQGDGVLADVSEDVCGAKHSHGIVRPCHRQACGSYSWHSGEWSPCDATCGRGAQRRQVKCYDDAHGVEVGEEKCHATRRPEENQACDGGNCRGTWLFSDWSSKCSNQCGTGTTGRHIVCFKDNRQQDHQMCDPTERPETQQSCTSQKECGGHWFEGPWSDCSPDCGVGSQTREVLCLRAQSRDRSGYPTCELLNESECKYHPKPETERQCQGSPCREGSWYTSEWGPCSHSCGVGAHSRTVACLDKNKDVSADCPQDEKPQSLESCGNDICTQDDYGRGAQERGARPSYVDRPVDLSNKAGTGGYPYADDSRRRPFDINDKAGTLYPYDAQPSLEDQRRQRPRPPVDLNNKAGTLYDNEPANDDRRYARPPIDLNNKAGTLYDSAPQQDSRPPIDLNNKAGTLYNAEPQQDYRPPIDLNNKAGTLYDNSPQQDSRPPIDLNNKAGTLIPTPIDLNNKAGTLYDAAPQQDYRPPIDLNNKAARLYDAAPQQDYRPPIDLNNKAGTLYDSQPQQDSRPPIDLNNKAGTLYDSEPQRDYRPPIDLNNKAGTLYDAAPQQDYRPPIDLNNKAGTLYDNEPQEDYRPPVDLNNKAGTLYDAGRRASEALASARKGDQGVQRRRTTTTMPPPVYNSAYHTGPDEQHHGVMPPAPRTSQSRRAVGVTSNRIRSDGLVDIDVTPQQTRNGQKVTRAPDAARRSPARPAANGNGGACVDKIDRCRTVIELAFCRYDYYKKMCCKSCSA
ncbi:ADAMTS-like protein 4 [Hypsibius exemplaris]|uniref:ADAMTS-like protein 4 n=1 Tax=Hypsibius exemplaris TaxID=2072580 RepID=A0A1W0X0D5_HYPEX|nr:ADAMTS-like protein 4 [Hypsibius exemplaris]